MLSSVSMSSIVITQTRMAGIRQLNVSRTHSQEDRLINAVENILQDSPLILKEAHVDAAMGILLMLLISNAAVLLSSQVEAVQLLLHSRRRILAAPIHVKTAFA